MKWSVVVRLSFSVIWCCLASLWSCHTTGAHHAVTWENQTGIFSVWKLFTGSFLSSTSPVQNSLANSFYDWLMPTLFKYEYVESQVDFYLYTQKNRVCWDQIWTGNFASLKASNFDFQKKLVVFVHGFVTDSFGRTVKFLTENALDNHNVNVIAPDYGKLMSWWYDYCMPCGMVICVLQSPKIGKSLGKLLEFLIDEGFPQKNIHITGHSTGAHVAGFAGKYLNSVGKTIGRVTGLDPSSPGYSSVTEPYRLAASDAEFTDCIFTTTTVSVGFPICKANFYVNTCGLSQPGCFMEDFPTFGGCSHSRAVDLFAESMQPGSNFPCTICNTMPCVGSQTYCWPASEDVQMGYGTSNKLRGIFSTTTRAEFPFSIIRTAS